jgi:hypothetical protein
MPLQSPQFLFGLLLTGTGPSARVTVCKRQDGTWCLPGGPYNPENDEPRAAEDLVSERSEYDVEAVHRIGGAYTMAGGEIAYAYLMNVLGQGAPPLDEIVEVREVALEYFLTLNFPDAAQRRMVLDLFSVAREPFSTQPKEQADPKADMSVEGVFLDASGMFLVEDKPAEQRTWRRIDPANASGFLELS